MSKRKKAKGFLPKTIAGVKVPKKVRKGRFGEMLASPSGQKLIAEALLAAGAIAAGKKASENPKVRELAKDAKHKLADGGEHAAHEAGDAGGALAYALGEAARSFTEALRRGGEPRSFAPLEQSWTPETPSTEPASSSGSATRKQPTAQEADTL